MSNDSNNDEGMTKYAVEEERSGGKTASKGVTCPLCGTPAEVYGRVVLCPKHGSAPFERA
jgi:hypothetical protein